MERLIKAFWPLSLRKARGHVALLALLLVPLSACSSRSPPAPESDDVSVSETSGGQPAQYQISLALISSDLDSALPEEFSKDAARFLTRTLETAPDGDRRQWRSPDRSVGISLELKSTAVNGDAICRQTIVHTSTQDGERVFNLVACRMKNGTWAVDRR